MVGGLGGEFLSSSETVTYSSDTMGPWTLHPSSLTPARYGLKASRIGNMVYVSGGYDVDVTYSDILTWDPEHSSWSQVGAMAVARYDHAVTTVNYNVISQYCVGH